MYHIKCLLVSDQEIYLYYVECRIFEYIDINIHYRKETYT
jgi:hypothetical protein